MRVSAAWTLEERVNNCVLCNTKMPTAIAFLFLPFLEMGGKNLLRWLYKNHAYSAAEDPNPNIICALHSSDLGTGQK